MIIQNRMIENGVRYFKCIYNGHAIGRYANRSPRQAASKAFTRLFKDGCTNLNQPINFEIVECTRGKIKKCHIYEGYRYELDSPLYVEFKCGPSHKIVRYKFKNKITKLFRK
ncbi:MAG: hypothetical protein Harvfovirus3_46 [Harvfovirus sp.]|uniref:Uncharacterized protein n=1 Tax=Harvfovirus sp. TaxID=2487768 RepID=A0A3G5A333_9VIRU|nr:MAG: hypothetical protein Harvfovirus3_46 [Harvfovirus sp.]